MAHRGRLSINKLDDFAAWAETKGWVREPTKGLYEVLRLRHPKKPKPALFFKRDRSHHATEQDTGYGLVSSWLVDRRLADAEIDALEDDCLRNMGLDDAVDFGLEDVGNK